MFLYVCFFIFFSPDDASDGSTMDQEYGPAYTPQTHTSITRVNRGKENKKTYIKEHISNVKYK